MYHYYYNRSNVVVVSVAAAAVAWFFFASSSSISMIHAKEFKVALWGDLPYHGKSENIFDTKDAFGSIYQDFRDSINDHIRSNNVVLAFHTGDIKSGSSPCIPLYYNRFIDLANSIQVPTLITMGDNEWTDCYRSNFNPIERLHYTRTRLYNNKTSSSSSSSTVKSRLGGGNAISISSFGQHSTPYIENQYIIRDGVIFALLHVTGSNNNLRDNNGCDKRLNVFDPNCVESNVEYLARDRAVNNALQIIFQKAKEQQLTGIMIVIQAHFWGGNTEQCNSLGISVNNAEASVSSGYRNFMKTFMTEVSQYHTIGDVVVVHGDAHYYRNCYPTIYNNVAFVMVPGSADISWVLATIDSEQSINNVFTFQHIDRPFQPVQPVSVPISKLQSAPMIKPVPVVPPAPTPTDNVAELCTIKYKVYDGKTDAFITRIVANEKIQNPPCQMNIEVVITCSDQRVKDKSIRMTLRRVVDMKLIYARTEDNAPYFLFGNNGSDIYEGTSIGQARFQIRVRSFDTALNSKLPRDETQFRLGECV